MNLFRGNRVAGQRVSRFRVPPNPVRGRDAIGHAALEERVRSSREKYVRDRGFHFGLVGPVQAAARQRDVPLGAGGATGAVGAGGLKLLRLIDECIATDDQFILPMTSDVMVPAITPRQGAAMSEPSIETPVAAHASYTQPLALARLPLLVMLGGTFIRSDGDQALSPAKKEPRGTLRVTAPRPHADAIGRESPQLRSVQLVRSRGLAGIQQGWAHRMPRDRWP